jgi:hypothetical protein
VSPCACIALLIVYIVVKVIQGFEAHLLVCGVPTISNYQSVFYHPVGS